MSFHQTTVIGNLTDDPEMKYVGETEKTTFSVAVNDRYKDKERVTYYDVEAWGRDAENVAEHMRKGRKIHVTGKMQMDEWTSDDNTKRRKWYLRAEKITFLDKPPADDRDDRRRDDRRDNRRSTRRNEEPERQRDDRYNDLPF